jgi:hypothetical protein
MENVDELEILPYHDCLGFIGIDNILSTDYSSVRLRSGFRSSANIRCRKPA